MRQGSQSLPRLRGGGLDQEDRAFIKFTGVRNRILCPTHGQQHPFLDQVVPPIARYRDFSINCASYRSTGACCRLLLRGGRGRGVVFGQKCTHAKAVR